MIWPPPPHLLIIDDEEEIRTLLREWLTKDGFRVTEAADAHSALALLASNKYDLLITDLRLRGDMDGAELVNRAREREPELRSLFISGRGHPQSENPDYDDFMAKPFDRVQVIGCVWELLYRRRGARLEQQRLRV
jgi:DNA-binding NtrC family response regulator